MKVFLLLCFCFTGLGELFEVLTSSKFRLYKSSDLKKYPQNEDTKEKGIGNF